MPCTSETTTADRLRLLAQSVPLVLIGTAALQRLHPQALARYVLPDLDVLLRPEALGGFVAAAQAQGLAVTCWGEPWQPGWALADVAGRWYVRATGPDLHIDATFECPFIDVEAAHQQVRWVDGLPIGPEPMIWRLKWIKDPARCASFAQQHGLTIPAWAQR